MNTSSFLKEFCEKYCIKFCLFCDIDIDLYRFKIYKEICNVNKLKHNQQKHLEDRFLLFTTKPVTVRWFLSRHHTFVLKMKCI